MGTYELKYGDGMVGSLCERKKNQSASAQHKIQNCQGDWL